MDYFDQESDRLRFRKLTEQDIPSWVEFFVGNDRLKYLGIDLQKSHEALADEWIRIQLDRYDHQNFGHLAVELKKTGDFIGMGGILPRELNGKAEYEIAYSLKPKYWGYGYATEIAKTMKNYGFNSIDPNRLISMIEVDNADSAKVAVKNGMNVIFNTVYKGMDVDVYSISKRDYTSPNL